ncbi:MAG: Hpt domain-containing protein, partial [Lentisphaeraceae bacterium]|nr:Hpt domain-containing protein [Lentisphaeraceae bacterium]
MFDNTIDPAILIEFIDESLDSIAELPQLFIEMEKNPHDKEIIDTIFRPVHSIKGNAAFFGMLKLKKLTHEMETTLDHCRKGKLIPNKKIINSLLKGFDFITDIFNSVRNNKQEIEDEPGYLRLLEEVTDSYQEDTAKSSPTEILSLIKEVISSELLENSNELNKLTKAFDELCIIMGRTPEHIEAKEHDELTALFKIISQPIDDILDEEQCSQISTLLKNLEPSITTPEGLQIHSEILDEFNTFVGTVGFDSLLAELISDKLHTLSSLNCFTRSPSSQ